MTPAGRYAAGSHLPGPALTGRARAVAGRAVGCAIAALILLGLAIAANPTTASGATVTLTASADAYVRSDQSATNFGAATQLASNGSSTTTMISYLRFDVTGLSAPPTSATLSYYSQSSGTTATAVHLVTGAWSEGSVTYANRPAYGATISTTGALTAGTRATANVSSVVTGNGSYSFALTTTATATRWADSREAANPPQLLLTENSVTPTPTPTSPAPSDTATATASDTASAAASGTATASDTGTASDTATASVTASDTASDTGSASASASATESSTAAPTDTSTATTTATPTTTVATTSPSTTAPPSTTAGTTSSPTTTAPPSTTPPTTTAPTTTTPPTTTPPSTTAGTTTPTTTVPPSTTATKTTTPTTTVPPSTTKTTTSPTPTATSSPPASDPVIAVVGDIACDPTDVDFNGGLGDTGHCHMKKTASLAQGMKPVAVLTLGDHQYNSGSSSDFLASYDKSWNVLKSLTHPIVGNHEYGTSGAAGYFGYFKTAATGGSSCTSGCNGYYSFNIGSWHVVAINTECTRINGGAGCATGSPQEVWLKNDLATHPAKCTLVMGHRPRWSSNSFASADIAPLVTDMVAAHVDLYLAGHSHSYERFAPMNASGTASSTGMTEMVIGTGGSFYTGFGTVVPNSVVHKSDIFGVMKMTLHATSFNWSFVADPSTPFTDSGSRSCT